MSGTEDDVVKTITRTITKGKARQGKASWFAGKNMVVQVSLNK